MLAKLEGDEKLNKVVSAREGLIDMRKLFEYLEVLGVLNKVSCYVVKSRSAAAADDMRR